MKTISFDQLPDAIAALIQKVDLIAELLSVQRKTAIAASSEKLPDLLTIKQASDLVNLAIPTIYGLVGRRGIPFMKISKKLYFRRDDLLAWIETGRRKTAKEVRDEVFESVRQLGQQHE